MSISRADILISKARTSSANERFSDTQGLSDDHFLIWLNRALDTIQMTVAANDARVRVGYETTSITGVESYAQPSDIFLPNYIYGVDYSHDGQEASFCPLKLGYRRESYAGSPTHYLAEDNLVYLAPYPTTGSIRVRYEKALDNCDKRRGQVRERSQTGQVVNTVTLESATVDDDAVFTQNEVFCVNSYDGVLKMRNLPIASYDSSSKVITVVSGWQAATGETLDVGDYVTVGWDTTTHPKIADVAELYLIDFMKFEAEKIRSNTDSMETRQQLASYLSDIVDAYSMMSLK